MGFGPLYVVDHPAQLGGFVAAAGLAVLARGVVQARTASWLGDDTALRAGRGGLDLRKHADVYGVVAWVIGGVGWGTPVLQGWRTTKRGRLVPALLGPIVMALLALGWAALAVGLGATADNPYKTTISLSGAVHDSQGPSFAVTGALVSAAMAILAVIPAPPLDGWPILRAVSKPSAGLERARYQLEERNIGILIAFAFAVLPQLFQTLPDPVRNLAGHLVHAFLRLVGG